MMAFLPATRFPASRRRRARHPKIERRGWLTINVVAAAMNLDWFAVTKK